MSNEIEYRVCSVLPRQFAIPWTVALQAPLSMEFSRQAYCSVQPFPSPGEASPGSNLGLPLCKQTLYCLSHQSDSSHYLTNKQKTNQQQQQQKNPKKVPKQEGPVPSLGQENCPVHLLSSVRPAFLSVTNSWGMLKQMSTKLVMLSNGFPQCRPFLFPSSIFPSTRKISWKAHS